MNLINDFEVYLSSERNMSKNTVSNYIRDIKQFFTIFNKPIDKIMPNDVSNFIIKKKESCSTATTNRKLSALKTFFKFAVRRRVIPFSPAETVEGGKREQRLPKPIDEQDIDKLFAVVDNLRDQTLLEVLYGTGVRREELVNIKVTDINFNKGYIRVIGKGNKERVVPIHNTALKLIKKLVSKQNSLWLFPSRKYKGEHLSLRQVNEIVDKWVTKAGLEGKDITPHKFRHSFCSHLYENGADIKTIQDLAGHTNSNTTQLYTKVSNERNRREYLQFHPRSRKK